MKLFKSKKSRIIALLSTNVAVLSAALIISTISWFRDSMAMMPTTQVPSYVMQKYFDINDEEVTANYGKESNPYVISKPIHLYYLAKLSQDNAFNFDSNTCFQFGKIFEGQTTYQFYNFDNDNKIGGGYTSYLNMEYYSEGLGKGGALPPIGNASHPFVSKIKGHNLTVRNLHIIGKGYNDVGIFGYVGSTGNINNIYFDTVEIDTKGSVEHVNDENPHHIVHENPHVGYLAGHVANEYSFHNAYVDNIWVRNSETNTFLTNSVYGMFGICDTVNIPQTGAEDYHYSLDAADVHDYFDYKVENNSIMTQTGVLRDTENDQGFSGTVNDFLKYSDTGGSHYSYVGDKNETNASRNYSLATTGARELQKTYDLYRQDGDNYIRTFAGGTTVTTTAPDEANTAGTFMYYDENYEFKMDSKWVYYTTQAVDQQSQKKYFNVFLISYMYEENDEMKVAYLKTNGSTLSYSTDGTVPNFTDMTGNDYTYGDYFFCFKDAESDNGVKTITDYSFAQYKIFCPKYDKYLLSPTSNLTQDQNTTLTSTFNSATRYVISGRTGQISYTAGTDIAGFVKSQSTHHLTTKRITGTTPALLLTIKGSGSSSELSDDIHIFKRAESVSELTEGMNINFVAWDNGDHCYFAMGNQANNNRLVSSLVEIDEDDWTYSTAEITNLSTFEIEISSSKYMFKDVTVGSNYQNQYLYAASSSSNYLRTMESPGDDGKWTIEIDDEDFIATVTATGSNTRKLMQYNNGSNLFSCYATDNPQQDFMIFVDQGTTKGYKRTETSTSVLYNATGGSVFDYTPYSVYFTDVGANINTKLPLEKDGLVQANFTFSNLSKVVMPPEERNGWRLITGANDLKANERYVLAYNTGGKTAGDISNSTLSSVASTFSQDKSSISDLNENSLELVLEGTPGNWKFKASDTTNYLSATIVEGDCAISYTSQANATPWSIAFSSGDVTIFTELTEYNYALAYDSTNNIFKPYASHGSDVKDIQIYRYFRSESTSTFFGDEIKTMYNEDYDYKHIDVVGGSDIYSTYFSFDNSAKSHISAIGAGDISSDFVTTLFLNDALVLFVPNNGSLDYGTLTMNIVDDSAVPAFLKGGSSVVTFADVGCDHEDEDENQYKLSLNRYNIKKLCYCALGGTGGKQILSAYGTDGVQTYPTGAGNVVENASISQFVLVIGGNSGAAQIEDVDLTFNSVVGNTGDFGTVGFRKATYTSGLDGNGDNAVNTASSTVPGQLIDFTYDVPANAYIKVKVEYKYVEALSSYVYEFTVNCSENITLYIYNYNAEEIKVRVNGGNLCKESYNVVNVTATVPPSGGWA